jgi:O-antigen ligase
LKLRNNTNIDIKDFYEIKISSLWSGFKQETKVFWFLCFYFFMEYVRPQAIYPVIDIIPWAQIALIFALGAALFDKNIKWVSNPENKLVFIFFFIVILSSSFAFNPAYSWKNIDVVINWLVLYYLIITIINTEKKFFLFMILFLLVNFKMSQHGFRTFAMRGFSFTSWGTGGAPGWFQNSGEFGIQMTIFVPIVTAFILPLRASWSRIKKIFFYLMPITGIFSIAASSSRGAQLAICAVGIWFILKSRAGIKAVLGIAIAGWLLYSILPPEMFDRYDTMGKDDTSLERLSHWKFGMDVIHEYPYLGIGYNNWLDYCNFANPEGLEPKNRCRLAHNTYIETASEIGIPAFIIMIIMILLLFWINLKTRKQAKRTKNNFLFYMSHGLDGGLVGYLVSSFFISVLFYPFIWVQLAITVALYEVSKNMVQINNTESDKP